MGKWLCFDLPCVVHKTWVIPGISPISNDNVFVVAQLLFDNSPLIQSLKGLLDEGWTIECSTARLICRYAIIFFFPTTVSKRSSKVSDISKQWLSKGPLI